MVNLKLALLVLLFVWSGFVRTGLGFGGALLTMPFILLVDNRPLVYLPIIAAHLLVFAPLSLLKRLELTAALTPGGAGAKTVWQHFRTGIDWRYLKKTLPIVLVPKIIGVLGLVSLPATVLSPVIYGIVCFYGLAYVLDKPIRSTRTWMDYPLLMVGAYISGTSLMGGPLIMAVYMSHVAKDQLRDTLFVLWFILVFIKMLSFAALGVDLQWQAHAVFLPAAFLGHWLGEKFHSHLVQMDSRVFYRVIGASLLAACVLGLREILPF